MGHQVSDSIHYQGKPSTNRRRNIGALRRLLCREGFGADEVDATEAVPS
jgi:hypothetical protein